ncbi:hypothetical protein SAMN05421812_13719 [Asanoa hainanensis]|uniref:Uncharacterized protein n=1 Tax=Asanoa hainanensis TaxID=560556 RepID=A0A239PI52_9ACTN|nr:hypothetical protein SAMN05421812_13719 [Asanoa hainanensis]
MLGLRLIRKLACPEIATSLGMRGVTRLWLGSDSYLASGDIIQVA